MDETAVPPRRPSRRVNPTTGFWPATTVVTSCPAFHLPTVQRGSFLISRAPDQGCLSEMPLCGPRFSLSQVPEALTKLSSNLTAPTSRPSSRQFSVPGARAVRPSWGLALRPQEGRHLNRPSSLRDFSSLASHQLVVSVDTCGFCLRTPWGGGAPLGWLLWR